MEKIKVESHKEVIICPECETEQSAEVLHTWPWASYVHVCTNCNYIIMESEWTLKSLTGEELKFTN